tara:strand:- start:820 stop:948 length:129 start_codon:yes stop_codon:yes gene_type:complete
MKKVVVAKLKSKYQKFDELKKFLKKKYLRHTPSRVVRKYMHV